MVNRKAPPRLPPEQLMVVYLDEIASRLADQAAEGKLQSKSFTVGTNWYTLETAWMAVTIFNDGDNDVYIRLDDMSTYPWQEGEAPLKANENIRIDLGARGYPGIPPEQEEGKPRVLPLRHGSPVLCFICQSGSAAVRVFRVV